LKTNGRSTHHVYNGPVHTQDNGLGASDTRVWNRPLSRKGLICMPWNMIGIRSGCQYTLPEHLWPQVILNSVATSNDYEDIQFDVISSPVQV